MQSVKSDVLFCEISVTSVTRFGRRGRGEIVPGRGTYYCCRPMSLPLYDEILVCLADVGAVHSPAEAHGMLCALLALDVTTTPGQLFEYLVGQAADWKEDSALLAPLRQLFEETRTGLQDPLLGFELLLPDEEAPLDERLEAATRWAAGFLYGWLKAGRPETGNASPEIDEFIADCKALAVSAYQTRGEPRDEDVYLELIEYLRMGVLLAQEDSQPLRAPPEIH